jgi:hypothetical protein
MSETWDTYAIALKEAGRTYTEIAFMLRDEIGLIKSVDQLRAVCAPRKKSILTTKDEVVGVIPDRHAPFAHPNHLEFLYDTFNAWKVTRIVCIGDLVDWHAVSRFQTETDAMGTTTEYELAKEDVARVAKMFPVLDYIYGNHCTIIERRAAEVGVPAFALKAYRELMDFPDKWSVADRIIIDNVLYEHGIGCTGVNGAINKSMAAMQSCVIGHSHSFGGCLYRSNSKNLIFGLNSGCGIDIEAYAFRYGKHSKHRETLGCGIVKNSSEAYFVPMRSRYLRSGK